jgi:hypothetical protein
MGIQFHFQSIDNLVCVHCSRGDVLRGHLGFGEKVTILLVYGEESCGVIAIRLSLGIAVEAIGGVWTAFHFRHTSFVINDGSIFEEGGDMCNSSRKQIARQIFLLARKTGMFIDMPNLLAIDNGGRRL